MSADLDLDLDRPERFSVATVGPVGQRVFLLHVAQGAVALTLKVEKQQVAVLSGYLSRVVREMGRPGHLPEDLDFNTDVEPTWVVGTMGVSYDQEADRVVVVIEEIADDDDRGWVARVALSREQAAAFAIRATRLVEAGRPPCPLCGLPLDPTGHDCPRTNGHRPPVT